MNQTPIVFVVEGLREWVLGSVHYGGVNVTDTPTEFMTTGDPSQLRVALTRRTAALTGRVIDAEGDVLAEVHHVKQERIEPGRGSRAAKRALVQQRGTRGDDDAVERVLPDVPLQHLLPGIGAHVFVLA